MPNQFPASRYLLLAIAVLMLGAAIPDIETLVRRARQLRQFRTERVFVIDGVRMR